MDDLKFVVSMLKDSNKAAVARAVGLSSRTVRDIAKGLKKKPSYNSVRRLAEYFKGKDK